MNLLSLIEAKRDSQTLASDDIICLVRGYASGQIPDYQMAALLMAIYFRGLSPEETRALTLAMRDSGETLRFPHDPRPLADKHSTGGVGDKVSLVLAPVLACLGFRVPMISGRGLGITGGTLDKLESIPGFQTSLPTDRIIDLVQTAGCVICGQTENMTPADKAMYALRDVTGTVPSIPLITASILSKKLAEGIGALLLDVKFGSAAFMRSPDQARELARTMVALGNDCGVHTRALLTNMDAPLGRAAGNWLEVKEAVAGLQGRGPEDLQTLVVECAAQLLEQTGMETNPAAGRARALQCLASGGPRRKWDEMLAAQGADLAAFERNLAVDRFAPVIKDCRAIEAGFVANCNARMIGEMIRDLGGGRLTKNTVINPYVGVDRLAKPGEAVKAGSVLGRIHAGNEIQAGKAAEQLQAAFRISREPPELPPLVLETVG